MINLITCVGNNWVIGNQGQLPWSGKLSDDLRHFRAVTKGHMIVMGRKTCDAIGKRLKGRVNVVLSRNISHFQPEFLNADSVSEVLDIHNEEYPDKDIFIIGGAEIYRLFLPHADKIYLTRIYEDFEGDTFFPQVNWNEWQLVDSHNGVMNSMNLFQHRFFVWGKRK